MESFSIEKRAQMVRHMLRQKKKSMMDHRRKHPMLINFGRISNDLRVKIMNKDFVKAFRCSRSFYITAKEEYKRICIHGLFIDKMPCMHPRIVFRLYNFHDNPDSVKIEYSLQRDVPMLAANKLERKTVSIFRVEVDYFTFVPYYAMDLAYFYYPEICIDLEIHGGLVHKDFINPIASFLRHINLFNMRCDKLSFRETIPEIKKEKGKRTDSPPSEHNIPHSSSDECMSIHKLGCKLQALEVYHKVVEVFLPRVLRLELGPYFLLENQLTPIGLQRLNSLTLKMNNSENMPYDFSYMIKTLFPVITHIDVTIYRDSYKDIDSQYLPEFIWPQVVSAIEKLYADPMSHQNRELHLSMEDMDMPYSITSLFSKIADCTIHEFTNWGSLSLIAMPIRTAKPGVLVVLIQPSLGLPGMGKGNAGWAQCHWNVVTTWQNFCDFVKFYSSCGQNLLDKQQVRFDLIHKRYFLE